MPSGPTTAALDRDVSALRQRIEAIELDIRELRNAYREGFEADRERIASIDKDIQEAKRIVGDLARDIEEAEKKVASLEIAGAGNKPWIDLWKKLAYMAICGLAGAALAKLLNNL